MTEREYLLWLNQAKVMIGGDYAAGYERGLQRLYQASRAFRDAEHQLWMSLGIGDDYRTELGRGYRDGYAGRPPAAAT
jgi:hypothetical protein